MVPVDRFQKTLWNDVAGNLNRSKHRQLSGIDHRSLFFTKICRLLHLHKYLYTKFYNDIRVLVSMLSIRHLSDASRRVYLSVTEH